MSWTKAKTMEDCITLCTLGPVWRQLLQLLLFQLAGKAGSSAKWSSFKRQKAPKAAGYTTSKQA
jgi:hypothetical protein